MLASLGALFWFWFLLWFWQNHVVSLWKRAKLACDVTNYIAVARNLFITYFSSALLLSVLLSNTANIITAFQTKFNIRSHFSECHESHEWIECWLLIIWYWVFSADSTHTEPCAHRLSDLGNTLSLSSLPQHFSTTQVGKGGFAVSFYVLLFRPCEHQCPGLGRQVQLSDAARYR